MIINVIKCDDKKDSEMGRGPKDGEKSEGKKEMKKDLRYAMYTKRLLTRHVIQYGPI